MLLYHITDKEYSPGKVCVDDFVGDSIYHCGLDAEKKQINMFLSECRPNSEPPRQKCIYLLDNQSYCVYLKREEYNNGERLHLYECEVEGIIQGHPMVLVNQFVKAPNDKWASLREEYWSPSWDWKFKEYLAEEVLIVGEIQIQELIQGFGYLGAAIVYAREYEMANRFVKKL